MLVPSLFAITFLSIGLHWGTVVLGIGESSWNRWMLGIASLLWLLFLIGSAAKKRWARVAWSIPTPSLYFLALLLSTWITEPQLEEARRRGDTIDARAQVYLQSKGEYPADLETLAAFDGVENPTTGVGVWGSSEQHFRMSTFDGKLCMLEFDFFRADLHSKHIGASWRSLSEIRDFLQSMSKEELDRFLQSGGSEHPQAQ